MLQWGFDQGIVDEFWGGFWDSLTAPVQDWLSQYPWIGWLLANPGWLLVAVVFTLFLLSGLLRAVASLTEKLWLGLLRLPILLIQWVWQSSVGLMRRPLKPQIVSSSLVNLPDRLTEATPDHPDRLTEVLNRLETLRREQDELMQEVKLLLSKGGNGQ